MSDSQNELRAQLAQKNQQLQAIATQLKTELFGIDPIIDRVIDSVRAWYVLPELVSRPVIVCLWGLTGTGKTQLVRRLAQLLGFYDRFVEVQMDGFSNGAGWRGAQSISGMLAQSGVREGEPGILALDEFQRFRTIDNKRGEVRVERYQDVWALLSDGRLPPALSLLGDIESAIAEAAFDAERADAADAGLRFKLRSWEAQELQRQLKLDAPLLEIMAWTPEQIQQRLRAFHESGQQQWETDYSRLLVFVCGNLDEMYEELATSVDDCDSDADTFHSLTGKLSVIDVKQALNRRFKPEQVARLGNEHVIYPSLSRRAYEQLIEQDCARYARETEAHCGLHFELAASVREQIYANAVFPAQGTRPLFSSLHAILGAGLAKAALWALERGAVAGDGVGLTADGRSLVVHWRGQSQAIAAPFEISRLRQRSNADFRALLAVHEAGHGLVHALLFDRAPTEIKIHVASFEGGYNAYTSRKVWSSRNLLDSICTSLAGRAAELLVFGPEMSSSGAESDLRKATEAAARMLRHLGHGARIGRVDVSVDSEDNLCTDVEASNAPIEALLQAEHARATQLLEIHRGALLALVDELLAHGQVTPDRFATVVGLPLGRPEDALDPYAQKLAAFRAQRLERLRA
ncbi:AAA family ATPase [Roseateles saccharophilus]|uniref:Cell division protease FtsH n=1 Tax=Roseateles saccharophilus TaxID=304 RepID=A0A4R3VBN1_ROSSA|nr:AAA family ATPase [Roseateles saccharophilus]MDG0831600.1 AAA family ATPase [Roseateles saccharophilus]TCV00988.1 cell division protease FtsH [Roseateles saccharophilus]